MELEMTQKTVMESEMGENDQVHEKPPGTAIQIELGEEDRDKSVTSTPKAVVLVMLFNLCLIVAAIPVYLYFRIEDEEFKQRVLDFLIVGGALVTIPLLYCLGDLSEGRPNFYYI